MKLLLVTSRPEAWNECLPVLTNAGTLQKAASLEDAKNAVSSAPPALVILDLGLEDKALRQAVIDIMMIDASVHTAVVSDMEPEAFHEATEGLGILMPLPSSPTRNASSRRLRGSCKSLSAQAAFPLFPLPFSLFLPTKKGHPRCPFLMPLL